MRRAVTVTALGVGVAAASVLVGPVLWAEQGDEPRADSSTKETGRYDIGEIVEKSATLTLPDNGQQILHEPEARFMKVHFEKLQMDEGDYITVSNPSGSESYRYDSDREEMWANSITGDTAIVQAHSESLGIDGAAKGTKAQVDKVSRGLSPDEIYKHYRQDHPKTESVCGSADTRNAVCYKSDQPDIYDNAKPVGRMLIDGTTLCTAWRVGEQNRLLTNNHCISDTAGARDSEIWFDYACKSCDGDAKKKPVKVRGKEVIATDSDYDFTLFSVDDFEKIKKFGHLTLADRAANSREELYIPQHPGGRPTEIAMDSDADGGKCIVDDPSYDGYVNGSDVSYMCDTEFGSSGSPVISRDTHEVLGLHHFGGCPNAGVRGDKLLEQIGNEI